MYEKGCQSCPKHGSVQRVPATSLNSIVKHWPFRGWAMDLVGQIFTPSLKQSQVIEFLKKNVIHRFGLPQTITVDQGTIFNGDEIIEFATKYGIQILNSSPYFA